MGDPKTSWIEARHPNGSGTNQFLRVLVDDEGMDGFVKELEKLKARNASLEYTVTEAVQDV